MEPRAMSALVKEKKSLGVGLQALIAELKPQRKAFPAQVLALVVAREYQITPWEMAVLLTEMGYPDNEVAPAIHVVYMGIGQYIPAVEMGRIMLQEKAFPSTNKERMKLLLDLCQYDASETAQALMILYPFDLYVDSRRAWQKSGYICDPKAKVTIKAEGSWSVSPYIGHTGPKGAPHLPAKAGYAMPGENESALVARVGSQLLMIGEYRVLPANLSGELEFCPNDDLESRYGAGLSDNKGYLLVTVYTA